MAGKLNDARRSLQRAKDAAQSRLKELDTERRELRASIKQVNAALRALRTTDDRGQEKPADETPGEASDKSVAPLDSEQQPPTNHLG